ncbi:hypothetical protein [Acidovorax sp.]|uniref:hypothetical protein n=1 Tax=Acidovorax sp. TaxID=1872122 RepID=UPI00391D24E6
MAGPIDSSRSAPLPPVAQFLAEAALQRQSSLLGLEKPAPVLSRPGADPAGPPPTPTSPPAGAPPLPPTAPADKASISAQARELGAGFDPRRAGADGAGASGAGRAAGAQRSPPVPLPSAGPPRAAAPASTAVGGAAAAWPASGLSAPLMRLVSALVQQVTAGSGAPQRVVSAQPWPMGLAQALESGTLDADQPPLQTWLVRQGTAQTPEGPRGFSLTLRVPVPWLAAQAPQAPAAGLPPSTAVPTGAALQVPFAGNVPALQSGVTALVLQGMEPSAPRTSALLVLDFQPQLAATVYGREMLQQATAGRLDPWTQMAVMQASGQVPREEDRARNGASGLCETVGCPYAARAACVQPFCMAMRGVLPPDPVGPVPLA